MLEHDFIYWLAGAIAGSVVATIMATREHRWLRRPLVVLLSAVIGAWVSSQAGLTSQIAGREALLRSVGAAWCYPWAWLFILNYWRRSAVSVRILHLPRLVLLCAPLAILTVIMLLLFLRATTIQWAIGLLVATGLGTFLGQMIGQASLHNHPALKDPAQMKRFRRALMYPTLDGRPLASNQSSAPAPRVKKNEDETFDLAAQLQAEAKDPS